MRTTDESIDKAAGLRFKRSPPARIRMDTSVMISLSLRLFYLFIFFYPIAVYVVEFYNVLRKKGYPWFYSTVHKFQIIFPFSSLSLFIVCGSRWKRLCLFYSVLAFYARRERKKKSFSRNESPYASRIEFIKLINNFFLGYFLSLLQLLFSLCLSLFLPLTRSITHKSFSNVKPC